MAPIRAVERLHEYHGNIHMHTTYSDGGGPFDELVDGAVRAGLDFVIVTDHNVLVRDKEEGYRRGVLTLVGQEVNDRERAALGNHLLCLGVENDVSGLARDPQALIDGVKEQGGLAFLAHPIEERTSLFPQLYPWESWEVTGYHGVELWNYLSSFRGFTTSYVRTALVAYFPHLFARGPLPAMLQKWDVLTQSRPVVALGGTDVHAIHYRRGPISKRFLNYEACARALNTHILTDSPMLGQPAGGDSDYVHANVLHDRKLVLDALRGGRCWVGHDLLGLTRGFRFWAEGTCTSLGAGPGETGPLALMGDTVPLQGGGSMRLRVELPQAAEVRLVRNGRTITQGRAQTLSYDVRDTGVYRVEVWKHRWGKLRGWIFSNPIYVRRGAAGAEVDGG